MSNTFELFSDKVKQKDPDHAKPRPPSAHSSSVPSASQSPGQSPQIPRHAPSAQPPNSTSQVSSQQTPHTQTQSGLPPGHGQVPNGPNAQQAAQAAAVAARQAQFARPNQGIRQSQYEHALNQMRNRHIVCSNRTLN